MTMNYCTYRIITHTSLSLFLSHMYTHTHSRILFVCAVVEAAALCSDQALSALDRREREINLVGYNY